MSVEETEVIRQRAGQSSPGQASNEPAPRADHIQNSPAERRKASRKMPAFLLLGLVGALAGLLVLGIVPRLNREKKIQAAATQAENNVPSVQVITARRGSDSNDLELPGNIEAIQVTTINARTSGYLRKWYVDIGDRVK